MGKIAIDVHAAADYGFGLLERYKGTAAFVLFYILGSCGVAPWHCCAVQAN